MGWMTYFGTGNTVFTIRFEGLFETGSRGWLPELKRSSKV
jgi:hypothetical protein